MFYNVDKILPTQLKVVYFYFKVLATQLLFQRWQPWLQINTNFLLYLLHQRGASRCSSLHSSFWALPWNLLDFETFSAVIRAARKSCCCWEKKITEISNFLQLGAASSKLYQLFFTKAQLKQLSQLSPGWGGSIGGEERQLRVQFSDTDFAGLGSKQQRSAQRW